MRMMPQPCSSFRLVLTLERDGEGFSDLFGGQRLGGDEEQGVNLRDGAVNAPAGAHFAPMEDEAGGSGGERGHGFL